MAARKSFRLQRAVKARRGASSAAFSTKTENRTMRSYPTSLKNVPMTMFIFRNRTVFSRRRSSVSKTRVTARTEMNRKAMSPMR